MGLNPQALPEDIRQEIAPDSRPGIRPAIGPFIFAAIACAAVFVLFSKAGIIYDHADLSFIVTPFVCYYVLRFLSRLSLIYLPAYTSPLTAEVTASIFTGLAFSIFVFLFLSGVEALANLGVLIRIKGFFTALSSTAGYAVVFVTGITISKLADIMRVNVWGEALYPIANALGQFFAGIGIWQFMAAFSGDTDTFEKIGLVILAGMLAVAISNAGHYGENSGNPFIADASRWLIRSAAFKFIIGASIAIYILFIHPSIANAFRYTAIVEWVIVCFLAWRLFSGIKSGIRLHSTAEVFETDWQKHVQMVNNLQGTDFPQLREVQELFTGDGSRDALLIYLTLLLNINRVSPEEIMRILHPLINYRDAGLPWFAFGWEQRRALKRNEEKRRRILEEIIANLKYIMNPSSQRIEEHAHEENQP